MRNTLPTGGNTLANIDEFTINRIDHNAPVKRMSLIAWLTDTYGNSIWPVGTTDSSTQTIHIDAAKPANLDIYYETFGNVWTIIWMQ